MRFDKMELVHTHALLNEIQTYLADGDEDVPTPDYDALGVEPVHIHKPSSDHKDAVLALAGDLADAVADDEMDADAAETPVTA